MATFATSDQLLVIIDPVSRRADGESVRIAKDVLSAGAASTKVCVPEDPEEFARALARRGSRRPVVIGDDRALARAVALLHRQRALAECVLSVVPVGGSLSIAHALGVPTSPVAAARAVLDGVGRRLDLLVDDSDGVVLGALRIPALPTTGGAQSADASARPWLQSLVRTLVPVRGAFHCAAVVRWIDESIASVKLEGKSSNDMLREITELASPASSLGHYALFDLPIEQLCGQIGAGADRLLDDSASKVRLAAATMPEAVPADAPQPHKATNVITVLAASSTEVQQFLDGSPPYPPTEPRDRMRLRADIAQRIQRNIDRLQISTTFWWRRLLRGLAVAICWTLGLTLLKDAVAAVVFAIAGGFVATVARDLVAIVEKSRR